MTKAAPKITFGWKINPQGKISYSVCSVSPGPSDSVCSCLSDARTGLRTRAREGAASLDGKLGSGPGTVLD